jgi:hypothetical protein
VGSEKELPTGSSQCRGLCKAAGVEQSVAGQLHGAGSDEMRQRAGQVVQ